MTWCIQCGETGRPERAVGVDVDGEPACGLHRVRTDSVFLEKPAAAPSPVQMKAEGTMDRICNGFNRTCGVALGDLNRTGLCTTCYARKEYHESKAKNGGAVPVPPKKTAKAKSEVMVVHFDQPVPPPEPMITIQLPASKVQRLLSLLLQ